jgi:hypothetical protein
MTKDVEENGPVPDDRLPTITPPGQPTGPTAQGLVAMAPVVRLGFLLAGIAAALGGLSQALPGGEQPSLGRAAAAGASALATVVLYGLTGWLLGRMLPAIAEALSRHEARAQASLRTASLIERELIPGLLQIAELLGRTGPAPSQQTPASVEQVLDQIDAAIREARFAEADDLLARFLDAEPDHPAGPRLAGALDASRQRLAQELRAQIEAARAVNDPERVLELRAELANLLAADALVALDAELARWFMAVISKRLRARAGVPAELATLVARVSEKLGSTREGASLRDALPTIRRSAGLCPRCAQPYTGAARACPKCLAPGPDMIGTLRPSEDLVDDDEPEEDYGEQESIFL